MHATVARLLRILAPAFRAPVRHWRHTAAILPLFGNHVTPLRAVFLILAFRRESLATMTLLTVVHSIHIVTVRLVSGDSLPRLRRLAGSTRLSPHPSIGSLAS